MAGTDGIYRCFIGLRILGNTRNSHLSFPDFQQQLPPTSSACVRVNARTNIRLDLANLLPPFCISSFAAFLPGRPPLVWPPLITFLQHYDLSCSAQCGTFVLALVLALPFSGSAAHSTPVHFTTSQQPLLTQTLFYFTSSPLFLRNSLALRGNSTHIDDGNDVLCFNSVVLPSSLEMERMYTSMTGSVVYVLWVLFPPASFSPPPALLSAQLSIAWKPVVVTVMMKSLGGQDKSRRRVRNQIDQSANQTRNSPKRQCERSSVGVLKAGEKLKSRQNRTYGSRKEKGERRTVR